MRRIDIVAPVFNEEASLRRFHEELGAVLDRLPYRFRVILVDDGSEDGSPALCAELARRDPRVEYLRFSRNFGHQAAITAGLDAADADAVITMDSDLQHPPSALPAFIARWEAGAQLVSGVREGDADVGLAKGLASRAFYRILNAVSDTRITPQAPDFRLLDAVVVDAVRRLREQGRFLRGMYAWVGFRQETVPYRQAPRAAGTSKYSARRMSRLALSALLGFSRAPLRLALLAGASAASLSFLYGLYAVVRVLWFGDAVPGWASIAVLVAFLSGVQLLVLGIIGEYLGQVLDEAKGRPLYLVAEASGRLAAELEGRRDAPKTAGLP